LQSEYVTLSRQSNDFTSKLRNIKDDISVTPIDSERGEKEEIDFQLVDTLVDTLIKIEEKIEEKYLETSISFDQIEKQCLIYKYNVRSLSNI